MRPYDEPEEVASLSASREYFMPNTQIERLGAPSRSI
jgi:hypothetical protein